MGLVGGQRYLQRLQAVKRIRRRIPIFDDATGELLRRVAVAPLVAVFALPVKVEPLAAIQPPALDFELRALLVVKLDLAFRSGQRAAVGA